MTDSTAAELLKRARAGDRAALDALFERMRSALERQADERLGERLREKLRRSDLVQSTYLEMLKGFETFRGDDADAFAAWAKTVMERQITEKARYFGAKKRDAEHVDLEALQIRAETASPSVDLAAVENLALVKRALLALPENYRWIIEKRTIEGLEYEEIAATSDLGVPALRTLFWRARAALTIEFKRLEEGR